MAIIDYHKIRNFSYAQLSPSAKILIPVLACLCDDYTGEIPDDYSSAKALAAHAGIGERSVGDALRELAKPENSIVALETKNGRIPSIQYRPVIRLGKKARENKEFQKNAAGSADPDLGNGCRGDSTEEPPTEICPVNDMAVAPCESQTKSDIPEAPPPEILSQPVDLHSDTDLGNGCVGTSAMVAEATSLENEPQTPVTTGENKNGKNLALNDCINDYKTTTDLPVSKILIKDMMIKHGVDVVVKIISGMEKLLKLDPNHFYNPAAYFRMCCSRQWVPTNKTIQEKEKSAERRKREKERQESERSVHESMQRRIEAEQNDPEAQARIAAAQAEFWEKLNTPPPVPKHAISGNARFASSFA